MNKPTNDKIAGVAALTGAPVLVVGDVMLDRYVYGSVERISPEGPIPVLHVESETAMLGGAGNVVRNLAAIGGRPHLVATIGKDGAGQEVGALLGDAGTNVSVDLIELPGWATTVKTRFVAARQQLLRADKEDGEIVDPEPEGLIIVAAKTALAQSAAVVLSDYGKGVLTQSVLSQIIEAARAASKPVIVDPMGADYSVYRGADLLTPNAKELEYATGISVIDDAGVVAAAEKVVATCGIGGVLVTRGADGVTLVRAGEDPVHLLPRALEVFDVSGAGDTVVAVLACALAASLPLVEAIELANVAGGIVVGKVGTAVVGADELSSAAARQWRDSAEAKVQSREVLAARVEEWRKSGCSIGFTNGCFDLLHPGHVSLLQQAKAICDRLIVGLNSDVSARALKGSGRPVQDEAARAVVLASLATVDAVVLFSESTPLSLIEAIRPNVLIKGADYELHEVVGAELVQGYGGKVLIANLAKGHSTTETITRLVE